MMDRARRSSILDTDMRPDMRPSELLAAQGEAAMPGGPPGVSRARARTNSSAAHSASIVNGGPNGNNAPAQDPVEMQNARAVEVLDRVQQKLTGRDFKPHEELDVISQVNKLIIEATKLENLCQHYIGWCSFW